MTLIELSEKFLEEIGTSLTFTKAEIIGEKINNLIYTDTRKNISQTDKEIIYDYIQQGIRSKSISVEVFIQDSQNAKNRNAATYLLQIIKDNKTGDKKK